MKYPLICSFDIMSSLKSFLKAFPSLFWLFLLFVLNCETTWSIVVISFWRGVLSVCFSSYVHLYFYCIGVLKANVYFLPFSFLLLLWEFHTTYFDHINLLPPAPSASASIATHPTFVFFKKKNQVQFVCPIHPRWISLWWGIINLWQHAQGLQTKFKYQER